MSTSSIFITGGHGFIGKNIIENSSYRFDAPNRAQLEMSDAIKVDEYFNNKQYDYIIHGASVDITHKNQKKDYSGLNQNLRTFINVFKHRHRVKRFINLGSGAEYGRPLVVNPIDESYFEYLIPQDNYGLAKFLCTKMIENENVEKAVSLQLFGVFGPYEDYETRFISNAIVRSLLKLPIIIKNQNVEFDYLYSKDLARILEQFVNKKPEYSRYNIATGQPVTLLEIAEIIREIIGRDQKIVINNSGIGNAYTANNKRVMEFLGSGFKFTPMAQAIEELIIWYEAILPSLDVNLASL